MREKIKREYLKYFLEYGRDTNRKKLADIRHDIKELNWIVKSNKDDIKNRLKEGFGWCWYLGEKYTQFDLQKDILTIEVLKDLYKELKK